MTAQHAQQPRWRPWLPQIITIAIIGLVGALAMIGFMSLDERADNQEAQRVEAEEAEAIAAGQREMLADDVRTLREQVEGLGEEPEAPDPEERVESVGEVVVLEGKEGKPGPGPTFAQIKTALVAYFAENPLESGRSPTESELDAAVSRFCAGGACQGDDGTDGTDGTDGEPGRPPTVEEIAAVVLDFCAARDDCQGDDGDPGRPPTAEEILAGIETFCSTRDECQGDPGPTCPEGIEPATRWIITVPDGTFELPPPNTVWQQAVLERVLICPSPPEQE